MHGNSSNEVKKYAEGIMSTKGMITFNLVCKYHMKVIKQIKIIPEKEKKMNDHSQLVCNHQTKDTKQIKIIQKGC